MCRCQSHRNLFVITAKTITPSFVPIEYSSFQSSPIRQSSSDSNCLGSGRPGAIHFRRTGWTSSLASSCTSDVVNKIKSLSEISEEQSSRSLGTIHRFIDSLQHVQKGICCRIPLASVFSTSIYDVIIGGLF